MKTMSLLVLAVSLFLAAPLAAKAKAHEASNSGSSHGIGIGAGLLPGNGTDLKCLTGDFWLNDKIILGAYLGFGSGSVYNGGTDGAGKPVNDGVFNAGVGVSGRFNLMASDSVYFNLMGRLGGILSSSGLTVGGVTRTNSGTAFSLFVGPDVEAFIPMWPSISVEASAGLNVIMSSSQSSLAGSPVLNESNIFLGGTNSLPLNVAFHYYF